MTIKLRMGLAAACAALLIGCGSGDGSNVDAVAVSGAVSLAEGGASGLSGSQPVAPYRIQATSSLGTLHATETDENGHFTLMLPPHDSYVMGFEYDDDHMEMHFGGFMVFSCADGESDHFYVGGREPAIDLGTILIHPGGGFARPEGNPLQLMDRDGDGVPDADDPDTDCPFVDDHDHDGFYDDDLDHDGHHDDDFDHDGHHDCEPGGMMHHGGHDDRCDGF